MEEPIIEEGIQWIPNEMETLIQLLNNMTNQLNERIGNSSSETTALFQQIAKKYEADKMDKFPNAGTFDLCFNSQSSILQTHSLNTILRELDKDRRHIDFVLKTLFLLKDQWEIEVNSQTKIKDEDSIIVGLEYIKANQLMLLGEITQAHFINRLNLIRIKELENNKNKKSVNNCFVSVTSYKGLCLLLAMKTSETIVSLMNYYDQIKDMEEIIEYQAIEGDITTNTSVQLSFLAVWVFFFQLKRLGRPDVMREIFKVKIIDSYKEYKQQRIVLKIHFLEILESLIFCKELQPKIQWLLDMKDLNQKTSESSSPSTQDQSLSFWDDFKYQLYLYVKASQTDPLNPYAGLIQILLMLQNYDQLIASSHERFKQEKINELKEILEEAPCIIEPAFTQKYVNLYIQKLQRQLSLTAKMKTAVRKEKKQEEIYQGDAGEDVQGKFESNETKELMSFFAPISEEQLYKHLDVLTIAGDYNTAQQIVQTHLKDDQFQDILKIFSEDEWDTYKEVIPHLDPNWLIKQVYQESFNIQTHYHFLRLCRLNTLYLLYLRNHEEALDQCRIGLGLIGLSHGYSFELLPFLRLQVKLARYVQQKDLARETLKYIDKILWLEADEHDDDGEEEEEEDNQDEGIRPGDQSKDGVDDDDDMDFD